MSKKFVPGVKFLKKAIIFTMLFNGGLIPYYLTLKNLGFINNILVMILPTAISTFYLIIVINYFLTFSKSLEESAKIDGANDIFILFRIVLPASLPTLACITLFYSVDRWNEWWLAMIFISDLNKYPLQLLLRDMLTNYAKLEGHLGLSHVKVYDQGLKMAVVVFTALPILCVYPFLQKYFTSGIMVGSVKG